MIERIEKYIKKHNLLTKATPILLACSGGRDSMFALDILIKMNYKIGVAHCNFSLRDNESDEEEIFVKQYCEKLNLPYFSIRFDTNEYAKANKISTQMAARELRYEWLEKIRKQNNYHQIITAHHLNDQAETIFINLSSGTGIEGLKGIQPKNGHLARPFLTVSRKEITEYVVANNIPYRDDSSNESDKYERNFIRHHIIDPLEKRNPNFLFSIESLSSNLLEQTALYKEKINDYKKKLVKKGSFYDTIYWDFLIKKDTASTLFYEIMHDYGFSSNQCKDIFENLKSAGSGSQFHSASHTLFKDRNLLYVQVKDSALKKMEVYDKIPNQIIFNNYKIKLNTLPINELCLKTSNKYAFFDLDKIKFPLAIRYWREGDYFYPYGLKKPHSDKPGKKKISKYFKDEKIPLVEKDIIPLLFSGEHLIWLVGNRIDDRFAITAKTKHVLKCQIIDFDKDFE